ncbi:carbohydrate binding domain-containing protein [Paenibacillus sp. GYB003]|uniref:carbohydrate binding domain-containing protein n=1 Tax=Paenibacillus sp. GYB003 TaxID=2994392 RepID=UPI002F967195
MTIKLRTALRLAVAWCLLLTGMLAGLPEIGAADSKPPNLLVNPGFETPGDADRPVPGWRLRGTNPAGISMEATDSIRFEGTYALKVTDDSTSTAAVAYSDPVEVSAGDTLRLRFHATGTTGTMYVGIRTYKQSGDDVVSGSLSNKFVALPVSNAWTEYSVEADAPAGAAIARVLIYSQNAGRGSTVVDDLRLNLVDTGAIPYELTNLGSFVHNVDISRAVFHTDSSGKTIAYATLSGLPAKLLVIDVEAETVLKQIAIEDTVAGTYYKGEYVRGLAVAPDGTVYMAGLPTNLFKYVPGEDRVRFVKKMPGSAVYDLKFGPAGVLIGGTYNKNEAFEYDTATGELVNLGRATPDEYYLYSVAYDEARNDYYFGIGSHAHLIRYDRETGAKTEIPLPDRYASAQFVWDMSVAGDKLFMRLSPGATVAMDLNTGAFEETSAPVTSRLISPLSPDATKVYFTASSQLGHYDFGTKRYTMLGVETFSDANGFAFARLADPQFPGDTLVAVTEGRLFKYNVSTGNTRSAVLRIEGEPSVLQTVAVGNDGRVHTSGYVVGGNAIYDPVNGKREEYSKTTVGVEQTVPGNQTDRVFGYKDKMYYVTYTGMRVYEYDQALPWDRQDPVRPNPAFLFTASDVGHQDRGLAGTVMPDEGKLLIGTVPKYGFLGGALVIFDLETKEREVYWNVVDQQSVTAVTYKDGFVYGGSNVWGGLGIDPTETEAKLFIWDVANKRKVYETVPVPGKKGITELIVGPDGNIWGSAEGDLFIFDPETRQVVHRQNLVTRSYGSAVWRDARFVNGPDGNVYIAQAGQFMVIDAATKQKQVIRKSGKTNWLAQDDFGYFYLTEETELLKLSIPGLIARPIGARLDLSATTLAPGESADVSITGLLEKGRTVQKLERRSPQWFSSNPSVANVEGGRLVAKSPGSAEIWAQTVMDGVPVETGRVAVTVAKPLATGAPGKPVLSDDSGHDTGLRDGSFTVAMNMWWGNNGTSFKLYENGTLIESLALPDRSPNPQTVKTAVYGKVDGTYTYTCELANVFGTTACQPLVVQVTDAAPGKPAMSADNWDGDGAFGVTMNMWWGTNGTEYRLYENGRLIETKSLQPASPNAQNVVTNITGRAVGTYEYRGELVNAAGATSSDVLIVNVVK